MPKALSSRSSEGDNSSVAAKASATDVSAATILTPPEASRMLRTPSMPTGSVSQTTSVCTDDFSPRKVLPIPISADLSKYLVRRVGKGSQQFPADRSAHRDGAQLI